MSGRVRTQRNTSEIVVAVQKKQPLSVIENLVRHSKRKDIIEARQKAHLITIIDDESYTDVFQFLDSYLESN